MTVGMARSLHRHSCGGGDGNGGSRTASTRVIAVYVQESGGGAPIVILNGAQRSEESKASAHKTAMSSMKPLGFFAALRMTFNGAAARVIQRSPEGREDHAHAKILLPSPAGEGWEGDTGQLHIGLPPSQAFRDVLSVSRFALDSPGLAGMTI